MLPTVKLWTCLAILTLRLGAGQDKDSGGDKEAGGTDKEAGCGNCCHESSTSCESATGCIWWDGACYIDDDKEGTGDEKDSEVAGDDKQAVDEEEQAVVDDFLAADGDDKDSEVAGDDKQAAGDDKDSEVAGDDKQAAGDDKQAAGDDTDSGDDKDSAGDDKEGNADWEKSSGAAAWTETSMEHSWNGTVVTRTYMSLMPMSGVAAGIVVVLLPDGNGCDLASLVNSSRVIVLCPQAVSGWQAFEGDAQDSDFIASAIRQVATENSINVSTFPQVIVTGFSAGGSMAYRVGCEQSQVIGGLAIYGQSFLELTVGHVGKDDEVEGETTTETALRRMRAARGTAGVCSPSVVRPHYALVGTQDNYYGEEAGSYRGEALWEFYSTQVLGCTGQPVAAPVVTLGSCKTYGDCATNRYCTVPGKEHDTIGWADFVATAVTDWFTGAPTPASTLAPTPAATPAPTPAATPAPTPSPTPAATLAPTPAATPAPTPAPTPATLMGEQANCAVRAGLSFVLLVLMRLLACCE